MNAMKELVQILTRLERLTEEVSALEFDTRWVGLGIAEDLWEVEKELKDVENRLAGKIALAQILIDRRKEANGR